MRLFLLLITALTMSSARAEEPRCFSYSSKVRGEKVHYCLQRSHPELTQEQGEPVAYFLHGIFSNENTWKKNGYSKTVEEVVAEGGFKPMTFVSFETSALSYFIDRRLKKQGAFAFETWMMSEFLPHIEKTHGVCAKRECRALIGNSMGGMGSLHLSLNHPEMFSVVAVNSPALLPYNIFDLWSTWFDYMDRTRLGVPRARI